MFKYDLTGKQFCNWTVLHRDESTKPHTPTKWICKCKCGTVKSVTQQSLLNGRSKSCGCLPKGKKGINSTHGMYRTRIYRIWRLMRRRCDSGLFNDYVERGITVCDEWNQSFESFYTWAISNGYSDDLTIDRIDNNDGYYPENCRWISLAKQQSNKRNNIYITYKGEKKCLRTLCTEIGFPYRTAYRRLQRMKTKNKPIDTDKLFEPIHTEKIAFRYRNEE